MSNIWIMQTEITWFPRLNWFTADPGISFRGRNLPFYLSAFCWTWFQSSLVVYSWVGVATKELQTLLKYRCIFIYCLISSCDRGGVTCQTVGQNTSPFNTGDGSTWAHFFWQISTLTLIIGQSLVSHCCVYRFGL